MRCILLLLFVAMFVCLTPHAQAQQVRISGLQDMTIRQWGLGDPSIYKYMDICIYRQDNNTDSRKYGIMAMGDGPGFFMRSGMYKLRYGVSLSDGGTGNPGGGRAFQLTSGVPLFVDLVHARIKKDRPENSTDCNGNSYPTARIIFTTSDTDLDMVPDGTYQGTINLTIMPL